MEYTKYANGEHTQVYDLDKCLLAIKTRDDDNVETILKLTEENRRLKSEHYKDEELQDMVLTLEDMEYEYYNLGFPISKKEKGEINIWHHKHCVDKHGNLDMGMTYMFTSTELGTIGVVKCDSCGAEYEFRSL